MADATDFAWLNNLTKEQLIAELMRSFNCLDKWVVLMDNTASGEIRELWRESHDVLTEILSLRGANEK